MTHEEEVRTHVKMGRDAGTEAIRELLTKVANNNAMGLVALGELSASVMIATYSTIHEQMSAKTADEWLSTLMQLFTDHAKQFCGAEISIQVIRKGE